MSLEERYTKAMELVGYERTEVADSIGIYTKDFKEMTKEEMRYNIQNFLKQYDAEMICTSRVLDSLATTVIKMIDSGQIMDVQIEVGELLVKDSIINFIKQRIPLVDKVSVEVQNSVKAYFEEHLKDFIPIEICRASNYPEDDCLYAVIAKQSNGEYACWTSWHQGRESMNYGHYGLPDKEIAFSIIKDNFNDISDEIEKYGPEKSLVAVDSSENIEKQWNLHKEENGRAVVVPFVNRSRGR